MRHLVLAMLVALLLAPGSVGAQSNTPSAYIPDAATNSVLRVDLVSGQVVDRFTVGSFPFGVTVVPNTPNGMWAYVTNFGNGSVSAINPATREVKKILVGTFTSRPMGIAAAADGSKVFVARFGNHSLSVIDTASNMVSGTPITVGFSPRGVAVNPVLPYVYVTNFGSDSLSVVDTATRAVSSVSIGQDPFGVAVADDGKTVFVALEGEGKLAIVNAEDLSFFTINVGSRPAGVAVGRGGKVYVANQASNTVSAVDLSVADPARRVTSVDVGTTPVGIAVSFDKSRIYVANSMGASLSVINAAANITLEPIGLTGSNPIAFGNSVTPGSFAINARIDVKPGSDENTINKKSKGTIPVAILGSPELDAATVNPDTVTFAGAAIVLRSNGTRMYSLDDVNNDGLLDFVFHVNTEDVQLKPGDTVAVVTGELFPALGASSSGTSTAGMAFEGTDSVQVR